MRAIGNWIISGVTILCVMAASLVALGPHLALFYCLLSTTVC